MSLNTETAERPQAIFHDDETCSCGLPPSRRDSRCHLLLHGNHPTGRIEARERPAVRDECHAGEHASGLQRFDEHRMTTHNRGMPTPAASRSVLRAMALHGVSPRTWLRAGVLCPILPGEIIQRKSKGKRFKVRRQHCGMLPHSVVHPIAAHSFFVAPRTCQSGPVGSVCARTRARPPTIPPRCYASFLPGNHSLKRSSPPAQRRRFTEAHAPRSRHLRRLAPGRRVRWCFVSLSLCLSVSLLPRPPRRPPPRPPAHHPHRRPAQGRAAPRRVGRDAGCADAPAFGGTRVSLVTRYSMTCAGAGVSSLIFCFLGSLDASSQESSHMSSFTRN